jgi:cation diffusion facilitator CzcD-associated flavoprotein CzcO
MSGRQAVVIGAGPAGLASAAELGRRGVPAVVLEQASAIGASWRGRYDRLRLNTSRWFAKLPGTPYAKGTPIFPSRDEVVAYLEGYAGRHAVDVRLDTPVERIDRNGTGWIVHTPDADVTADHVIVAGGYSHTPFVPGWPGRDAFERPLLHAADYRNPEPFEGGDVLVVGSGCSGMEIAYDLIAGGTRRVRLAVRTSPNILVRSPIGPALALALLRLPPRAADRIVNVARGFEVGDLTEYGLPRPEEGVFTRLRRLGVAPAIVDEEILEAIKERRIEIVAGVESLDATGVRLADGTRIEPDAVIAATGYRCGLEAMVGHLNVLDERGVPRVLDGKAAAPGLYFVGYIPIPAQFGHLGGEAKRAAKTIAREVSATRPTPQARRGQARPDRSAASRAGRRAA